MAFASSFFASQIEKEKRRPIASSRSPSIASKRTNGELRRIGRFLRFVVVVGCGENSTANERPTDGPNVRHCRRRSDRVAAKEVSLASSSSVCVSLCFARAAASILRLSKPQRTVGRNALHNIYKRSFVRSSVRHEKEEAILRLLLRLLLLCDDDADDAGDREIDSTWKYSGVQSFARRAIGNNSSNCAIDRDSDTHDVSHGIIEA